MAVRPPLASSWVQGRQWRLYTHVTHLSCYTTLTAPFLGSDGLTWVFSEDSRKEGGMGLETSKGDEVRNAVLPLSRNSESKETVPQHCTFAKGALLPQFPPWEFEGIWRGGDRI